MVGLYPYYGQPAGNPLTCSPKPTGRSFRKREGQRASARPPVRAVQTALRRWVRAAGLLGQTSDALGNRAAPGRGKSFEAKRNILAHRVQTPRRPAPSQKSPRQPAAMWTPCVVTVIFQGRAKSRARGRKNEWCIGFSEAILRVSPSIDSIGVIMRSDASGDSFSPPTSKCSV